ncbi:MAG: hypothetical protein CSB24_04660 [Deltaproteobacteria bacterium]|nr:MAG: hypothetical protein CSB24_04660 [Deltaproteobacteria bacterium]
MLITKTQNKTEVSENYTKSPIPPPSPGEIKYACALSASAAETRDEKVAAPAFKLKLTKNSLKIPIIPGSVEFYWGGRRYIDYLGVLYADAAPDGSGGIVAGKINYQTGEVDLDLYGHGDNVFRITSLAARVGNQYVTEAVFRTPGAPLRPGQVIIAGVSINGDTITATAGHDGKIEADGVVGEVDYTIGVVRLHFGEMVANDPAFVSEPWYDPADVVGGQIFKPIPVLADSLSYSCVIYSYIPLKASLLGLNPVRLPSDGRVPIVKSGDVVVVHNTLQEELPGTPAAGQTYTLSREADSVEIYDSTDPLPLRVPKTKYKHEPGENTITIDTDDHDFSGFTMPLVAVHKIEDMVIVAETLVSGFVQLTRGLVRDFPKENTFISSALLFGDMQARVTHLFDQKTWRNEFSNSIYGDEATGTYNIIDYPIQVSNLGAVKDRWAIVFDSQEHFKVMSELRGVVADGYTNQDLAPVNSATGRIYFKILADGWGLGWSAGNVLRFNTEAAAGDLWVCRTTQQGPEQEPQDWFTVQARVDAK